MNLTGRPLLLTGWVLACVATLMSLEDGIGNAWAEPSNDSQASCVYTLSAPFVVEVSGRKMVSATLTAFPCTGDILPNNKTVCVGMQSNGGPPTCAYLPGSSQVQVYFSPYRPGATYTSTGTGCGAIAPTMVSACATQGPKTVTL